MKSFAHIESVVKNAKNAFAKYNYVDLAAINEVINPYLIENKLYISSTIEDDILVTQLLNDKNETVRISSCPIILESDAKNKKHDYGAAITYARKYNLKMLFNLSENDDDGHKDEKNYGKPKVTLPPTPKSASEFGIDQLLALKENLLRMDQTADVKKKIAGIEAEISKRKIEAPISTEPDLID